MPGTPCHAYCGSAHLGLCRLAPMDEEDSPMPENQDNSVDTTAAPAAADTTAAPAADDSGDDDGLRFVDLGIDARVLAALQDVGYEKPSPIQAATIPVLLEGRDVVGLAQTGTGKTAAFAVPALSRLAELHDLNGPSRK